MTPAWVLFLGWLVVCLFIWMIASLFKDDRGPSYVKAMRAKTDDSYFELLSSATNSLCEFILRLDRDRECMEMLQSLPGLENLDKYPNGRLNPRLATIILCDARRCYQRLGNSYFNIESREGLGLLMLVCRLLSAEVDADVSVLRHQENVRMFAAKLKFLFEEGLYIQIGGGDYDDEFRFGVIFGIIANRHDLVQVYSTLMYRWASIIAKADGTIDAQESKELAQIMKMGSLTADGCNVKVSSDNGSSVSYDYSAADAKATSGGKVDAERT